MWSGHAFRIIGMRSTLQIYEMFLRYSLFFPLGLESKLSFCPNDGRSTVFVGMLAPISQLAFYACRRIFAATCGGYVDSTFA